MFETGTIEGYTVVAIDGTRLFKSNVKYCSKCLSTTVKSKNEYYHNGTVLSIIGDVPKITIDLEMYNAKIDPSKKDEGEQNASHPSTKIFTYIFPLILVSYAISLIFYNFLCHF